MTDSNGTALAVREFSDKQIRTRLDAASKPGFGMEKASRDQLNMIYLLAKHYDVDPAIDITLFQGRPFFTIDGRVRLMKRHPQYRGYRVRPLSKDEKDAWGYRADEIVVECSISTKDWGEISARGKVSPDEFRRQPVAGSYPQEMAEKRAIARASRMAFGQDVPDEDEALVVIEERHDPERQKALAAKYDQAFGSDADETAFADQPRPGSREAAEANPAELDRQVQNADDEYNRDRAGRLQTLQEMAKKRGVKGKPPADVDEAIEWLDQRITDADLAQEAALI